MSDLLWPDEMIEICKNTPIAIFQDQASLLGPKTNHIVEAKVARSEVYIPSQKHGFRYDFYLYGPILQNYPYYLFSTTHNSSDSYPVIFDIDDEQLRCELGTWQRKLSAKAKDEFLSILSQIFHAQKTQGAIGRIIAQSKDYEPDKEW